MSLTVRRLETLPRVALGLALLLSAFGVYESVDAVAALARPLVAHNRLSDLFRYEPWAAAHFVPGAFFMVVCPLQLWASFRNTNRLRHRVLGRLALAASVALGASGLALPFTMPQRPVGEVLFMVSFGLFFLWCGVRTLSAARRRDFVTHRRWAIRLYATGLTIATQRVFTFIFAVAFGLDGVAQFWFAFVGAGWLAWAVQVAAAEWWLRRRAAREPAASAAAVAS